MPGVGVSLKMETPTPSLPENGDSDSESPSKWRLRVSLKMESQTPGQNLDSVDSRLCISATETELQSTFSDISLCSSHAVCEAGIVARHCLSSSTQKN